MWKFASALVWLCVFASASPVQSELKELDKDTSRFMELVEEMLVLFDKVSSKNVPTVEKAEKKLLELPAETLDGVLDGKGLLQGLIINKPIAVVGNDGKYPLSVQLLISRNKVVTTTAATTTAATTTAATTTAATTTPTTTTTTPKTT